MKKVILFIGALVLLSNNIISPVVYADTDSNLNILLSKKVILGITEPNIDIMSKCDVNIDNTINVLDVISLKNRYLNSTVENVYARTNGLWRLDGATDTASIEMDGLGNFTMYYADGTIENTGYLECTDEYENGNFRYDMYNAENELIASFYFDSDTQFHIGNDDGSVYILDTQENVYACTNGLWRLDGATDTASIEMDGLGNFTMYYADGTIENTGYLECVDEYENGNFRYDMYNAENELIASFYFDSDTQFHIGNDDGTIYILDTQENVYACTNGLWRLDGATDTASIEMDGLGNFTMYYADGTIENTGYLECTDEYENGNFRYDMYNAENELIASFYFDSDTQFHIGNDDGSVYILDTQEDTMENSHEAYWGYWGYPDGTVLEIREETWYLYENNGDGAIVVASGPVEYDEEAAYLMNEDGSSGGSKVSLDENNNLVVDSGMVLTHVS